MSDDWQNGYTAGYQNGWEAGYNRGKTEGLPKNPYQQPQQDWMRQKNFGSTCFVCGKFFEAGKAYGYVCAYSHCPSKAYCSTVPLTASSAANAQWSSWMSGRPSSAVNTVPDGLSYEEIYGSVVYGQNRRSYSEDS